MGSNNTRGLSPRQKMINLMYIVLTAMLALNVSSDVLEGFKQVENGLSRSNDNVSERNDVLYRQLESFNEQNPDKGGIWYDKASEVRRATALLYGHIDSLKQMIAVEADGKDADASNILNQDNLEVASVIMLNPANRRGRELRQRVDTYREYIARLMTDSVKRANIQAALSTTAVSKSGNVLPQPWEESLFDNKPVGCRCHAPYQAAE